MQITNYFILIDVSFCHLIKTELHFFPLFVDVVREARSVVLVGGTMKPFDEFMEQIFRPAGQPDSSVTLFSCGHVIDTTQQLAIYTPSASPKGVTWDFTFKVFK